MGSNGACVAVLCVLAPPAQELPNTSFFSLFCCCFVVLLALQLTKLHQLAMQQSHFPMSHGNTGFSGTAPPPLPLSPALAEGGARALLSKPTQITQTKHFPPNPARPGNAILSHRLRGGAAAGCRIKRKPGAGRASTPLPFLFAPSNAAGDPRSTLRLLQPSAGASSRTKFAVDLLKLETTPPHLGL